MEWLAVIVGTVAAVLVVFTKGFSRGKDAAKLDNAEQVLDNVDKAKQTDEAIAAMPADERRERLRKYTK